MNQLGACAYSRTSHTSQEDRLCQLAKRGSLIHLTMEFTLPEASGQIVKKVWFLKRKIRLLVPDQGVGYGKSKRTNVHFMALIVNLEEWAGFR